MNSKIDKIAMMIVILTIILLNIFIGASIKDPIWLIQAILSTFTLCYIVIKKLRKEKHIIIKGKIDIIVLVFAISVILPYILKSYVSLDGTLNSILKYWSIYSFYILIRNVVIDEKSKSVVMKVILLGSIIPIILGFDKMTFHLLENVINALKLVNVEDRRMISTFGYANTYAIYLTLTTSIAIAQLLNSKTKKEKVLYIIYIILAGISILLTQSKAVLALIAIVIGIFILKGIKNKTISKKLLIVILCLIVMFFSYFFVAIQIGKPLQVEDKEKICVIRGIEANKEYQFDLDIEAQTEKDYHTFEIAIMEVTRFFSKQTLKRITFANFNGTKTIKIKTGDNIDHIEIKINNNLNQKLTIKELRINEKPYILDYKIILEKIVRIFTTFNFKNSSIIQRTDYWQDSLKIIADNSVIGSGGKTWNMLYGQKQEYLYYAQEPHSCLLDIWMSFGLLGIGSYVLMLAVTIQNGRKLLKDSKKQKEEYQNTCAMLIGIVLLIVHSMMDFDLSFLIIQMLFFLMIAILNDQDKKINKKLELTEFIVTFIIMIVSIGNILGFIAQVTLDESGITSAKFASWISKYQYRRIAYYENNRIDNENQMDYIKEYIKNEPYENQNTIYRIMCRYLLENKNIEDIQFLIDTWKNIEIQRKYEVEKLQERAEIMLNLAQELLEASKNGDNEESLKLEALGKEILKIIQDEYLKYRNVMMEYERNKQGKTISQYKYMYYTNRYNEATKLLEENQ